MLGRKADLKRVLIREPMHYGLSGGKVAFEVHGSMEDAGDFKLSVVDAKKDDVFALGGDAASGKKIRAEPVAFGILSKVFKP